MIKTSKICSRKSVTQYIIPLLNFSIETAVRVDTMLVRVRVHMNIIVQCYRIVLYGKPLSNFMPFRSVLLQNDYYLNWVLMLLPDRVAQLVGHLVRGPGFDTRSGHMLSFLFPLIQEGQLSVTGESMCTKYWFIRLGGLSLPRKRVVRLTDCPDMTIGVYR